MDISCQISVFPADNVPASAGEKEQPAYQYDTVRLQTQAVFSPADVGTLSAGNTDIWQEISINLYILMRICDKHYSFRSIVSLTAGLMCFIHFKMSINVQVMPQMYILLTGNLPCLSRVRRKQQIKERPADKQWVIHLCLMASVVSSFRFWQNHKLIWYKTKVNSLFVISFFAWTL